MDRVTRVRPWPTSLAAIAAALAFASPAPAQPEGDVTLATLGDALELDREVEAMGDDAVLAALDAERLDVRLGALRAARWLEEPERALPTLAGLAAGDDPDLAPAAARAAGQIAELLRHDDLQAREADLAVLDPSPWRGLADDESARADLRGIGARVAQVLEGLRGVPAPTE
ncbi:MAG: hypothetical protein JJ863_31625 [Deltaproteobacteria bacterium]|nr:hypothetical protein [Deltaproteobacteria bacterium]